ncbi:MAG: class II glutamine amidotransferase [Phycisphaeraceae bacterium]|nr:class II glutamine amidotransferase [Phycisphaerales bacterium]MCB9842725.1 class II glutamine amidotransferase [Phycisphaeraceae bacterium]
MCRFVLYLGPPLTLGSLFVEPSHSLIKQSIHALERDEPLNGDGFGVAWYAPDISPEPASFRSITPAWNNRNLLQIARVTRSPAIMAHVRAATQGLSVAETNCHPYTHARFAFMHNGDLGEFTRIRREMLALLSQRAFSAIQGSTDSEHIFGLVLDRLLANSGETVEQLAEALVDGVDHAVTLSRSVGPDVHSYLNIALTNGTCAVACRYTTDKPEHADSLYIHTGRKYVCRDGVCEMIAPEAGQGAVIVSSEPLSEDPGWQKMPVNHLVLINTDRTTELRAWPTATP